jgi:hypothetical protein
LRLPADVSLRLGDDARLPADATLRLGDDARLPVDATLRLGDDARLPADATLRLGDDARLPADATLWLGGPVARRTCLLLDQLSMLLFGTVSRGKWGLERSTRPLILFSLEYACKRLTALRRATSWDDSDRGRVFIDTRVTK